MQLAVLHVFIYDNYYFSLIACNKYTISIQKKMNSFSEPGQESPGKRLAHMQTLIGQNMSRSISPVGRWLNGILESIDTSSMRVRFQVRHDMSNPMGVLHGGIAATILDDCIGVLVYTQGREYAFTTINLNCDFLHAAKVDQLIFAEANIMRAGKNVMHVEARILDEEGKIIAKSSSNLIQTSFKIND